MISDLSPFDIGGLSLLTIQKLMFQFPGLAGWELRGIPITRMMRFRV